MSIEIGMLINELICDYQIWLRSRWRSARTDE